MFAHVNKLIPAPDQTEINRKLARHFSDEIKYAIVGRGINKCEKLIELLEEFDKIGNTNTGQQEGREWRPRVIPQRDNTYGQPNAGPQRNHHRTCNVQVPTQGRAKVTS